MRTYRHNIQNSNWDYTNALQVRITFECFRIIGKQAEIMLRVDVKIHLEEAQDNMTNWLIIYTEILEQTINKYHHTLWWQVETHIISQNFHM